MNPVETAKGLFFEGLKFLEAGDLISAETKFAQALELVPERPSILVNLSAVKIRLGKNTEAEDLARRAVKADPKSPEAWANLGDVLAATQRHHEAVQAYDLALDGNPDYAKAWQNKSSSLLALKRNDESLMACDRALQIAPGQFQLLHIKSLILMELKQTQRARDIYLNYLQARVAHSPVHCAPRLGSQRADILIINSNPEIGDTLPSFDWLQLGVGNFPCQLAARLDQEFHFSFVFHSDAVHPSVRKKIPQPDILINNHVNGDMIMTAGSLVSLNAVVDSFGVPVVNHPAAAVQTTRAATCALAEQIPGMVSPLTRQFSSLGKEPDELIDEIERQFEYPLITRTLVFQRGGGMKRIENRAELRHVLFPNPPEEFYVTAYTDSRPGGEGLFRKIRAAFVGGEIIVMSVDYDVDWKVHGRRPEPRRKFYLENLHLLVDERAICMNPEEALGRAAIDALRAFCAKVPLNVFGVDFNVDPLGRLVLYECNASMNLFARSLPDVAPPNEQHEKLEQACRKYLRSLLERF